MKEKSHRQRIEDEMFSCKDERFLTRLILDASIIVTGSYLFVLACIGVIAGIINCIA